MLCDGSYHSRHWAHLISVLGDKHLCMTDSICLVLQVLKTKGLSCLVCQLHFPRNYTYTPMVKCVHHTTHFRHDPVVSLVNCHSQEVDAD